MRICVGACGLTSLNARHSSSSKIISAGISLLMIFVKIFLPQKNQMLQWYFPNWKTVHSKGCRESDSDVVWKKPPLDIVAERVAGGPMFLWPQLKAKEES